MPSYPSSLLSPSFMLLSLPPLFQSSLLALRRLSSLGFCRLSSLVRLLLSLPCLLLLTLWFLLWCLVAPWHLLLLLFLLSLLSLLFLLSLLIHLFVSRLVLAFLQLRGVHVLLSRKAPLLNVLAPLVLLVLVAMILSYTVTSMTLRSKGIKSLQLWRRLTFLRLSMRLFLCLPASSLILSLPPPPLPLSFSLGWIPSVLCVVVILGYFSLFDKLSSVSKEVNEKFWKAADDKKRSFFCFATLG